MKIPEATNALEGTQLKIQWRKNLLHFHYNHSVEPPSFSYLHNLHRWFLWQHSFAHCLLHLLLAGYFLPKKFSYHQNENNDSYGGKALL